MALTSVKCPNCGSSEVTTQQKAGATGASIVVASCLHCGSQFTQQTSGAATEVNSTFTTKEVPNSTTIFGQPRPHSQRTYRIAAVLYQALGVILALPGIFILFVSPKSTGPLLACLIPAAIIFMMGRRYRRIEKEMAGNK